VKLIGGIANEMPNAPKIGLEDTPKAYYSSATDYVGRGSQKK
jgi:hypothetical protein